MLCVGVVKVWDSSNGQLVRTLEGPGGAVEWVKWHPKGNVVLAGSEDMTMWMWLAASGDCMQVDFRTDKINMHTGAAHNSVIVNYCKCAQ